MLAFRLKDDLVVYTDNIPPTNQIPLNHDKFLLKQFIYPYYYSNIVGIYSQRSFLCRNLIRSRNSTQAKITFCLCNSSHIPILHLILRCNPNPLASNFPMIFPPPHIHNKSYLRSELHKLRQSCIGGEKY